MRQVRSVLAGLVLLALVGGVPVLLVTFVGMPLPTSVPDWSTLAHAQLDSATVIKVFAVVVWLAWLNFLLCVLAEVGAVLAQLRGRPRAELRIPFNFGGQQVARRLVITTLVGIIGASALGPTAAMAAAPAAHPTVAAVAVMTGTSDTFTTETVRGPVVSPAAVSALTTPAAAAAQAPGTVPVAQQLPQYTVTGTPLHHDNLWDIAENHLGDPMRWHDIWSLNQQQLMNDGDVFEHPELIRPGWVLTMPADATGLPATSTAPAASTPEPSNVPAQRPASGAGPAAESAHAGAADGQGTERNEQGRETDSPTSAAAAAPAVAPPAPATHAAVPSTSSSTASSSTPTPATNTPTSSAPAAVAAAPDTAPAPQTSAATKPAATVEAVVDDAVVNVRTIGGIGSLLAAGLLGAVFLRRRRSDVRRRAGFRPQKAQGAAADVEDDLLSLHTPMSFELIDRGLRRLSADLAERDLALPGIVTARLKDDGLLLTLFEATELPTPWEQVDDDGFEWLLSSRDTDLDEQDRDTQLPAPWPSLVTLGHDSDDAQILVDLEELLALNIAASDEEQSRAMLRALALELATTPWGAGLQVTLVGCCPELADIAPERMRYLPDLAALQEELRRRHEDVQRVLEESGLDDIPQARQEADAADVWSPHIILVGHPLQAADQARICDLLNDMPRVGIAAVTTDEDGLGEWGLSVDVANPSWAELTPIKTRLRPQQLGGEEYASIVQLLACAESEPVQPAELVFTPPTIEPDLLNTIPAVLDLTVVELDTVAQGDLHQRDGREDPKDRDLEHRDLDQPDLERQVARDLTAGSGDAAHGDDRPVVDLEVDAGACEAGARARAKKLLQAAGFDPRLPLLRVLGPVDVQREGQAVAMTGRQVALGIYFALNPGATSVEVIEDFVRQPTTPSNLHPRIAELRKALGVHPDTGAPLMPLNTSAAGYRLHQDMITDWDLLQRLAASDDTDKLEAALSLVRGTPFARVGSRATRYYVWVERIEREMRQLVTDIAVTVAVRAYEAGQYQRAARATSKGLLLEEGHEQLRRMHWRALDALGEREALRRSVEELARINEELGCEEDPATLTLIDELRAQGALQAA